MFLASSLRCSRLLTNNFAVQITRRYSLAQVVHSGADYNQQTPEFFDAERIAMNKKRKLESQARLKQRRLYANVHEREGTNEEVLGIEVQELLKQAGHEHHIKQNSESIGHKDLSGSLEPRVPAELEKEVEFEIIKLSSTGDGLAYTPSKDHIVVIPFAIPGDTVLARAYKWHGFHSSADFIKLIKPSPKREGITPGCKYFGTCSGCQLQMLPYDDQLEHKKKIIQDAYTHFSGLKRNQIPNIAKTIGSPSQYGYRTKLTPHFNGPKQFKVSKKGHESVPPVGFNEKGRFRVLDIESCPIATDIVQEGLKIERAQIASRYQEIRNGETILIRENTSRQLKGDKPPSSSTNGSSIDQTPIIPVKELVHQELTNHPVYKYTYPTHVDVKTYISDNDALATEFVNDYIFVNRAGSFFQNNNSILSPFTSYIHEVCASPTPTTDPQNPDPPIKYLLDAYCGSGLFAITLSNLFNSALGIDVDPRAIEQARYNAKLNNLDNLGFIDADAADLFADVPFPPEQTLTVIDPPRRGASEDFLRQLCTFGPKRVIYVSCNVHTQARDVGMLVNGFAGTRRGQTDKEKEQYWTYEIESLRGFDFFPQTGHVEGVAVLNRVEKTSTP